MREVRTRFTPVAVIRTLSSSEAWKEWQCCMFSPPAGKASRRQSNLGGGQPTGGESMIVGHNKTRSLPWWSVVLVSCLVLNVLIGSASATIAASTTHEVQPGETLSQIAHTYGTSVNALVELNGLSNPNRIQAGQLLLIQQPLKEHVVQPGETLSKLAAQYGVTVLALAVFNDLDDPDRLAVGQVLVIPPSGGDGALHTIASNRRLNGISLRWPLEGGVISSLFGMRGDRMHYGVDIAAVTGTPVYAAAGGRVVYAGDAGTYGNFVKIDHGNGIFTAYAHNSRIRVRAGEYVKAGQHIADVGNTGRSSGPHLHFEVEVNGERIDPLSVLPARH